MKIMIFLHGTVIMHKNGVGVSREERVKQSMSREPSITDYTAYVPIGSAAVKTEQWQQQGAEIIYLSSHEDETDVKRDKQVLAKYDFPKGEVYCRRNGEDYKDVAERVMPDVLIEDDCESIGGEKEMTYPHIADSLKVKIKSIVVQEFQGIDHLPDILTGLISS
jgi:hypothetical protein